MSADVVAPTASSPTKEQPEAETKMDTSAADAEPMQTEEAPVNGSEEPAVEATTSKRKRSTKKPVEADESSVSNTRPRRTLTKREEAPPASTNGTSSKAGKVKAQRNSAEQAAADADDEQERDKNIPAVHDVADVVWVKMGGHPWWPSLIIRDPNDATSCFTKITGNARAKRMYFVAFYGSTADFAWVPDSSVIPYQGVEAFTKYAQDTVDKAVTKSQKEQLTERFQLKVTISRREDWEMAVREADQAVKQTSETRLEEIDPKIQFYRSKFTSAKGQGGRKSKAAAAKADDSSEPPSVPPSSVDASDRSTAAEKAFEDNSDAESSADEAPARKSSSTRSKLKKQTSNDSNNTPPAKRRQARKSTAADEHKTNGSNDASQQDEEGSNKKRARARISKPSVITNNGEKPRVESPPAVAKTPTQRKSATKPHPVSSLNNILLGQHHRFETRIGFLSPFEEQEVFDVVDQLRSTKTFDEAEQAARHRFEQILCLNLNKTTVDIPQDWFYSFLFAHPILIVKNPQWFNDPKKSVALDNSAILTQSSSSSQVLKHQLSILSKLYRNELQVRPAGGE